MKSKFLKLFIASAAVFGLSATALAKGDHQFSGRKAALLAKFDANKDGQLDDAEKAQLKAAKQQMRAARIAPFDLNKDGSLDDAEKAAMRDQRIEKRFAMLDANKDGVITLAEMKAAKPMGKHKRHRGFIK